MPTLKQKLAVKELGVNGGNISQAMKVAGYSDSVSKRTDKLTNTEGWKELMDRYIGDDVLAKAHKQLLEHKQLAYFTFPKSMDDTEITEHVESVGVKVIVIRPSDKGKLAFYYTEDANAKKTGIDMAYKLKGKYAPEKVVSLNVDIETDENLDEITNRLNDLYKGTSISGDGGVASVMGTEA